MLFFITSELVDSQESQTHLVNYLKIFVTEFTTHLYKRNSDCGIIIDRHLV